jgi:outer membrane protein assembly factor BamB
MLRTGLMVAVGLLLAGSARGEDHWPAFRGGALAGMGEAETLPAAWDTSRNVLWKADVPGRGWSSPIVWGDRVFLTSCISDDKQADPRKGLYIADLQGKAPPGEHQWIILCLDARTGKKLWQKTAFQGKARGSVHIKNTLASETPVTDGERVYAVFGNVGIVSYTVDGKEEWKQDRPARKMQMGWGTGASPAVFGGKLFIVNDNDEESSLAALDGKTGRELWRQKRTEKSNWATPFVWKHQERTEIVTAGRGGVRSYGLDGKLLWELKGMSIITIPTPFARNGLLYVSSGYVADPFIKPVYAIKPGASGDISLKKGTTSNDFIAWSQSSAGPYHPTPLAYGDYLYVLYDRGFLSCFEASTGKPVYENRRLGGGSNAFTASPWAYGGKLFCLSEDGNTFVIAAGPDFKVLQQNKLEEMALATPALAGGSLFLRTQTKLYCLREQK